ncbi:MAG: hypothetical protein H6735_16295 [Alphaproteobacteria bacterium]|nr:hypothetical protein [Alphaproteobacteria bacterium]
MSSAAPDSGATYVATRHTLFGHPTGLFALFFAEMWERFSYYGMRALLTFYMQKGFLSYSDTEAYRVYGAYTSLVYMTPFIGGMVADRFLGARRAVVLGGFLMAAGHLLMTLEYDLPFFTALGLLIVGNGFFKPNISTIVGSLYPHGSAQRDGGFTIFYMGINLGAALAPLLCGYVGEKLGWHYGFGLATIGMLVGIAVFVVPTLIARTLILLGALVAAVGMIALQLMHIDPILLAVNGVVALALVFSGCVAFVALGREGLPDAAGQPPDPELLRRTVAGLRLEWAVYSLALFGVPLVAGLVYLNRTTTLIPDAVVKSLPEIVGFVAKEASTPAGMLLLVIGAAALLYLLVESFRSTLVERQRLWVALILMGFSLQFWTFFEQAGTSINNFTDRNVDRIVEDRRVTDADVGKPLTFTLTQEQLGYPQGGKLFTLDQLDAARADDSVEVTWQIGREHVGMGLATNEIPASTFQSANPIFILLFGTLFSMGWRALAGMGLEPNTPVKFSLGLFQLAAGFGVLWWGAGHCDARGMVGMGWLILAYLLHTTGELCLSPVGLSMITKLSPARLVSTTMGAWFLATAYSSLFAAIIAALTGVGGEGGEEGAIPAPLETIHVYGTVFGQIGAAATVSGVVLLLISPILVKWMHGEK